MCECNVYIIYIYIYIYIDQSPSMAALLDLTHAMINDVRLTLFCNNLPNESIHTHTKSVQGEDETY